MHLVYVKVIGTSVAMKQLTISHFMSLMINSKNNKIISLVYKVEEYNFTKFVASLTSTSAGSTATPNQNNLITILKTKHIKNLLNQNLDNQTLNWLSLYKDNQTFVSLFDILSDENNWQKRQVKKLEKLNNSKNNNEISKTEQLKNENPQFVFLIDFIFKNDNYHLTESDKLSLFSFDNWIKENKNKDNQNQSIVPKSIQFDSKAAFKFFRNLPQNIIETLITNNKQIIGDEYLLSFFIQRIIETHLNQKLKVSTSFLSTIDEYFLIAMYFALKNSLHVLKYELTNKENNESLLIDKNAYHVLFNDKLLREMNDLLLSIYKDYIATSLFDKNDNCTDKELLLNKINLYKLHFVYLLKYYMLSDKAFDIKDYSDNTLKRRKNIDIDKFKKSKLFNDNCKKEQLIFQIQDFTKYSNYYKTVERLELMNDFNLLIEDMLNNKETVDSFSLMNNKSIVLSHVPELNDVCGYLYKNKQGQVYWIIPFVSHSDFNLEGTYMGNCIAGRYHRSLYLNNKNKCLFYRVVSPVKNDTATIEYFIEEVEKYKTSFKNKMSASKYSHSMKTPNFSSDIQISIRYTNSGKSDDIFNYFVPNSAKCYEQEMRRKVRPKEMIAREKDFFATHKHIIDMLNNSVTETKLEFI